MEKVMGAGIVNMNEKSLSREDLAKIAESMRFDHVLEDAGNGYSAVHVTVTSRDGSKGSLTLRVANFCAAWEADWLLRTWFRCTDHLRNAWMAHFKADGGQWLKMTVERSTDRWVTANLYVFDTDIGQYTMLRNVEAVSVDVNDPLHVQLRHVAALFSGLGVPAEPCPSVMVDRGKEWGEVQAKELKRRMAAK